MTAEDARRSLRETRALLRAALARMAEEAGAPPSATFCDPCDNLVLVPADEVPLTTCGDCGRSLQALPGSALLDALTGPRASA